MSVSVRMRLRIRMRMKNEMMRCRDAGMTMLHACRHGFGEQSRRIARFSFPIAVVDGRDGWGWVSRPFSSLLARAFPHTSVGRMDGRKKD